MSKFLGFESYLIPLGSTIVDALQTIRTALTSRGWQVIHDSSLTISESFLTNITNTDVKNIFWSPYENVNPLSLASWIEPSWSSPKYVGLKMKNPLAVVSARVTCGSDITAGPASFTIDYSDNGTDWTTALTVNGNTWIMPFQHKFFTIPDVGSHYYWRFNYLTSNNANYKGLSRVLFMDVNGNYPSHPDWPEYFFDVIPPSSEIIGDSNTRDLVRLYFQSKYSWDTLIGISAVQQAMRDFPIITSIKDNSYSSTVAKVGITITDNKTSTSTTIYQSDASYSSSNTPYQNISALFTALKISSDPLATKFSWTFNRPAAQNGADGNYYIIGERKYINDDLTITSVTSGANELLTCEVLTQPILSGEVAESRQVPTRWCPMDLTSGFIYYLQINSRGIALATKTNTTFSNVVHACYANRASALAVKPDSPYCSIIELSIGSDDDATNTDSWASLTHSWTISDRVYPFRYESINSFSDEHTQSPLTGLCIRQSIFDGALTYSEDYSLPITSRAKSRNIQLMGSNLWIDDDAVGNDFQIHRVSNPRVQTISHTSNNNGTYIFPQLDIEDWFKFRGTATSEALVLVADTQTYTTLPASIGISDAVTTLAVTSTTGFNATGYVCIGAEIFQYTGVSGNTLTGITRAKYGSVAADHFASDQVNQCLWFTVINGGALLCGYNKPS